MAAALAVKTGKQPDMLNVKLLQEQLREEGFILHCSEFASKKSNNKHKQGQTKRKLYV
jgi:hypothetical protein